MLKELAGWILDAILALWEVEDNPPPINAAIIVGMTLPQARDGSCSRILANMVRACAYLYKGGRGKKVVFSNRFAVEETNLARVARNCALDYGVPRDAVIIPSEPEHPRIRNTVEEARFALRLVRLACDRTEAKEIVIVANHLHMRRARAAFRRLDPRRRVPLYWVSARGREAYGADAAQDRFRHPVLFLVYELVAYTYSKLRGWA